MSRPGNPFRYFHSSVEVMRVAVMMYDDFPRSPRTVEGLLFKRDRDIRHRAARLRWIGFDPTSAVGGALWQCPQATHSRHSVGTLPGPGHKRRVLG